MKEKIVSFILIIIIMTIIIALAILGYTIYADITGNNPIQTNFEGDGYFFSEDNDKTQENTSAIDANKDLFSGVQNTNITTKEPISTNSTRHRYLYEQLNSTAKVIYDKLYENRENLKTGTYKIDFGNKFQELLSTQGGDVELKKQYQSAIEALIYENPEIFYLDATSMFINIEKITKLSGVKYNVYINNGSKPNYLIEGFKNKQDVEKYQSQIEIVRDYIVSNLKDKSNYEKIKSVHDYLIESIEYDSSLSKDNIYDIYGALVSRVCVCEGYAKAFQYLMNELDIDNVIVIGSATNNNGNTENHAWNYVKLNDKWYAVDTTWDDPIVIGDGALPEKSKYKYFLKGSITMNQNHKTSGKFTDAGQIFTYPKLNVEDYE